MRKGARGVVTLYSRYRASTLWLGLALAWCAASTSAQTHRWPVELPGPEAPFNVDSASSFPSMQQSQRLSEGFYLLSHGAIQNNLAQSPRAAVFATLGLDVLSLWLPLGGGWMHEEWHRAVMGIAEIDSRNGIYDFEFSDVVAVTGVSDEQLIAHKRDHPANQVRLNSAGLESQYELNFGLQRKVFFYDAPAWITPVLWMNVANNIGYLHTCATDDANTLTAEIVAQEGTDTRARDFTGLDCTAWVYDLFRPTESYAARGTHPSGVGVDRYRDLQDLADAEQRYLRHQRNLSLVNLVDPFLFGRDHFIARSRKLGGAVRWNANLRHHLTPFGYNLGLNVFLRRAQHNLLATLHTFFNDETWAPGLDLQVLRYPAGVRYSPWNVTTRVAVWRQPAELVFRTEDFDTGGLAAITVEHGKTTLRPYMQVEYKSDGWVAGNEYLGENWAMRLGVTWWTQFGTRPP